ncbi:hypothetical protein CPB83DRAFT_870558 [Crepidotus variabilis]|uniref:Peptidase S54 rhomboid domain-containing protein n=1 Tax=Crepidotus variabilis TaxID=179855 RepID=A0A9P6EBY5_9AGAR|nr:hypothetical protein CPB83DRAFT_870558 [Crepidotus variabilis]
MFWLGIRRLSSNSNSLSLRNTSLHYKLQSFTTTATHSGLKSTRCLREELPSPPLRTNKKKPTPENEFLGKIGKPGIWRQTLFVSATGFLAFMIAATETSLETEYWTERMSTLSPVWTVKTITNTDLKRAQNAELIQGLRETLANIQSSLQQLPVLIRPWINLACVAIMQPYADASEGKRLCWKLCLLNAGVWAAWKIRKLQPFMSRSFMAYPLSGLSYTLITSVFSHRSVIHLLFNCLALESFGSAAYYYLLKEQNKAEPEILESTTSYHFLAFFLSAGMFSGLVSHVVNAKFRFPRLVAELAIPAANTKKAETWAGAVAAASTKISEKAPKIVSDIRPSLGASGAIYAAVTMTALAFPESQVSLFIPPTYPINIQYGVGGLMMLDMIGIMRGWRMFDHWAHLGGAAFGIFYYNYGPGFWRALRKDTDDVDREPERALHP